MIKRRRSFIGLLLAFILAFSGTAFTMTQTGPVVRAEAAAARISKKKKTIYVGKTYTLKIKNSKKNYTWRSSNPEVVMIMAGGGNKAVIGGMAVGKATVTATLNNKTYKCKVTVKVAPKEKTTEETTEDKSGESKTGEDKAGDSKTGESKIGESKTGEDKSGDTSGHDTDNTGSTGSSDDSSKKDDKPVSGQITVPTLEEELDSDTYGLLHSHQKTDYIPRTEYSGIRTEDDLLKTMMDGVRSGTRGIVVNYESMNYNYWKTKYLDFINRSEMNNASNEFFIDPAGSNSLAISPIYKAGWFAVTYYRYVRPGMDEDLRDYITPNAETLKILAQAHELAEDAIKAHPDDERAILKYVNDSICDLTTYSNPVPSAKDDPARDITGVFVNHDAVCEGYTAAMQLVLNILGFENHTVKNKIDNHIWNRVKVDGTWYHIDATWNDRQNSDGSYKDDWFMLTDDEIDKKNGSEIGHAWTRLKFID